jgi:Carbohydrate binding domain (family 11)
MSRWSRSRFVPLAPLALLPGCLVAFNDYPRGDWASEGSSGAVTAGTTAASGSGGELQVTPSAGTSSGGSLASGGSAGSDVGGSSMPSDGGADPQAGGPDQTGGTTSVLNPNLIDDFEDGDELILEQQGRKGSWFISNDGTGPQTPDAGAQVLPSAFMLVRSGSTRGLHTSGGPFETWGAIVGTTLASIGDEPAPYDLSMFQGIRLWVRSSSMSPAAAKEVRLDLPTPATTKGGACMSCGDHFGIRVPLTAKWTQIEVPFANLKQTGFGRPLLVRPDLKAVTSLQFQFPENVSFDLWLDDVELY